MLLGRPCSFDFSGPPPPADWLVHGLIERGCVTVLSADSGAGKSLIAKSIAVAMMHHKPWCGRATTGSRIMFLDEENAMRVIYGRFKALGMTNDDRPNLRYYLRLGVQLGEDDWFERVDEEAQDFKPDLLVIDTAAAATAVEVNNNDAVAKLFSGVLRPLAERAAVLILHHEKKPQNGGQRHAGHAMMGARQWAGQADAHIALEGAEKVMEEEIAGGKVRRRYPISLEMPKDRDGFKGKERIVIVSEHLAGERVPLWTRVEKVSRHEG